MELASTTVIRSLLLRRFALVFKKGVTTSQLDELASETTAAMTANHPDYALLAARIVVSNLHRNTMKSFLIRENENLRRAIRGRQIPKQGLRILSMDGGGMKGLAIVQILKEIEKGTGKRIHELFDLICGTSTGGMLVALGIKVMTLEQCEEIYKNHGKLVFVVPVPNDNESTTWREKFDRLYKSSSQSCCTCI